MNILLSMLKKLPEPLHSALLYPPFSPQTPPKPKRETYLHLVQRRDLLLSYPFESMEPFLRLIREAASDPSVLSIQITIYRLAQKARLVEYLCAAAENGKEVTAVIELRARFDDLLKQHRGQVTESSLTRQDGCLRMEITVRLEPPITHDEALAFMRENPGVKRMSV